LPVIGTVINVLRKTTGISPQDIQQTIYRLRKENQNNFTSQNNVVVLSGHDHNLQYIEKENIKQIISGVKSPLEQ
jgi:predicted oxidoreductase (fatty acid repression mutant protein)